MLIEVLLLLLLILLYLIMKDRKPPNMPPGPFEIPFLGQYPFVDEKIPNSLRKKFGDIITVRTGNLRTILLFDYKTSKAAMASADFVNRPQIFSDFSLDDQKTGGLVGSNGVQWQHDRRFALRNLRNLGMGKSYMENAINMEAQELVNDLKQYKGEPVNFPDSLKTVALNIIWQMVAGRRYDLRSKEVDTLYELNKKFRKLSIIVFLPTFVPILTKILPKFVRNAVFKEDIVDSFLLESKKIVEKSVIEHEKNFDLGNNTDLTGEYLKCMAEEITDEKRLFRRGSLLQIINDLFNAGSDTISSMLKWTVFLLAKHPELAAKLRDQIDNVVPAGQLVSLTDKPNLPLVDAFVVETLRYSSMIVLNVQRAAIKDTTLNGYFIPKGTLVQPVNYSIHHDIKYWTQPHQFDPQRFIDDKGKFQNPKENFIAFGAGRRQCLGETLARMELFLFSAAIMQHFDITAAEGETLENVFENQLGFRVPVDHKLIYKIRE